MKKIQFLVIILVSNLFFAQQNFELHFKSKHFIKDSLMFGTPMSRSGFEEMYHFKIEPNNNVVNLAEKMGFPLTTYLISVQNENLLKGSLDYPIPVAMMHVNMKERKQLMSELFYIEKGKYEFEMPDLSSSRSVEIASPTNEENKRFKTILAEVYKKVEKPFPHDSLLNFDKKQEILSSYIRKNPKSYVALWEIINDYTNYNFNPIYFKHLELFSKDFKKNSLYQKFREKLIAEKESMVGQQFPDIDLDGQNKLTLSNFKKYKLTFIDYWSTSCAPCINNMPEIVYLYNEFKDKNINFISIADESKADRVKLANEILTKNNIQWINFFDINKDFAKKVNATGYPLHFIINSDGIIIERNFGDLEKIKEILSEHTK